MPKKNRRNYYRILHTQPDAPSDIIKASYRTQMQKLKMHPDLGGDEWNASVLNEAYQVLSNPEKRAAYDAEFIGDRNGMKSAVHAAERTGHQRKQNTDTTRHTETHDSSACPFCQTPKLASTASYAEATQCSGCNGPLQVAGNLRLADPAKRAFERMPQYSELTLFVDIVGPGLQGKLRDLSPVGLQLESAGPLNPNQIIRISGEVLSAIGRVVFSNRGSNGRVFTAGIEFLTVSFHERVGTFITETA